MVELLDALMVLLLGYSKLEDAAKTTWLLLRIVSDVVPVTSRTLARFAEIRGVHVETARRHLHALDDHGLLERHRPEGQDSLAVYRPLDPTAEGDQDYRDVQAAIALLTKAVRKSAGAAGGPPSPPPKGGGGGPSLPDPEPKPVDSWTSVDFLRFANELYVEHYGHVSLELEGSVAGEKRQGQVLARFKRDVLGRFARLGLSKTDARGYLVWLFETKSESLENIGIGAICSPAVQDGFLTEVQRRRSELRGRVDVTKGNGSLRCRKAEKGGIEIEDSLAWRLYDPGDKICRVCLRRAACAEMREG